MGLQENHEVNIDLTPVNIGRKRLLRVFEVAKSGYTKNRPCVFAGGGLIGTKTRRTSTVVAFLLDACRNAHLLEMKAGSDSRGESHRELIGTLKYAGWIALLVLAIIAVAYLCN